MVQYGSSTGEMTSNRVPYGIKQDMEKQWVTAILRCPLMEVASGEVLEMPVYPAQFMPTNGQYDRLIKKPVAEDILVTDSRSSDWFPLRYWIL